MLLFKEMEVASMKEKESLVMNETSHLCHKDEETLTMLRPHRQHQFHCDTHQLMDANTRQNKVSLHVPPYFQNTQKNC